MTDTHLPPKPLGPRWWRRQIEFIGHPSALLLGVLIAQIVLYPALLGFSAAPLVLDGIGIAALLLALRLIHYTRGFVWHAVAMAGVSIGLELILVITGSARLIPWQAVTQAILYFYTARCLIRYVLVDRRASLDELFAAAATFMLLVWAFTELLVACQWLQPTAFTGTDGPGDLRSVNELLFLSFALFTNTGIGTVVPMTAAARAIADLEMFSGVMYLALVISRLMGMVASSGVQKPVPKAMVHTDDVGEAGRCPPADTEGNPE